jgi:hypothetical protein
MKNNKEEKFEEKAYKSCVKGAERLRADNERKASILYRAYEAAVAELGYTDTELLDKGKSMKVAQLMFSDKYLGNTDYNPLLKNELHKDFAKKDHLDKETVFEHMFGLTLANMNNIARQGGLRRGALMENVEHHYRQDEHKRIDALAHTLVYDTNKSYADNMARYANVLTQDPMIKGAKMDTKNMSLEEMAGALTSSARGGITREQYQHRYGVQFN